MGTINSLQEAIIAKYDQIQRGIGVVKGDHHKLLDLILKTTVAAGGSALFIGLMGGSPLSTVIIAGIVGFGTFCYVTHGIAEELKEGNHTWIESIKNSLHEMKKWCCDGRSQENKPNHGEMSQWYIELHNEKKMEERLGGLKQQPRTIDEKRIKAVVPGNKPIRIWKKKKDKQI